MAGRRLTITVDEPLLDALHGEGARTCEPASRVAERVLRSALPEYVAGALRRDLAPVVRGRVLDVRSTPAEHSPNAQRPAELAAGRASELAQNADGIVADSARPRSDGATAAR